LLSGGLDSSIITALAKEHNDDLHTYSIGFDTTNELPQARRVANALDTEHHEYTLDKDDVTDYVDDLIYRMDEPVGDPGFLPVYILSQKVSEDYKVVLSGDGADEVFTGYDRYKLYRYGRYLRHLAIADFGNDILSRLRGMRGKDDCNAFLSCIRLFNEDELDKLGVTPSKPCKQWKEFDTPLESAQAFDINTLLPNDFFMKADKMSASFGLEQRVPFMDHDVVETGFKATPWQKLRGWREKHVLREAFKDKLPDAVLNRDKHGFDVPIDHWFKHELGEDLKDLIDESTHNLYHQEYAYDLLDDMQDRGEDYTQNFLHAQKLWSIYVFEKWHEEYIA
jgi:asparagine synthase (glutamine-hydrolysing)